jgi:hypothetical protein
VLLVPPEHQEQLQPLLEELGKIRIKHARLGNKART